MDTKTSSASPRSDIRVFDPPTFGPSRATTGTPVIRRQVSGVGGQENRELVEGEDFYREGEYIVFTEKYLRERGYCCESGCRHCPYGFKKEESGRPRPQ